MKSFDPIVNIFLVPLDSGGFGLRMIKASGACGFLSESGITSDSRKAVSLSNATTITLKTFEELENYKFKENIPVSINVLNDESKNQENTSYNWTGSILKWNAEVVETYQPEIQ